MRFGETSRPGPTALCLALACVLSGNASANPEAASATKAESDVSPATLAHIQHIESSILGPMLMEGMQSTPKTLAQRMQELHVPGVSIAVFRSGQIEWARGFGVTRIGGDPVRADTLFQAGSISKPVTAMAVLRLVQSGGLSLDVDVNQYLKTWKVPDNSFTAQKKVTLRELLTHTAGVTVHGFPGYAVGAPIPTLIQVLNGEPPANTPAIRVDTIPGTIWRYSGGGYVIAQLLLGDVTGKPFPQLMHDTVLAPIGMAHSTYEQPLPAATLLHAATPYDPSGAPIKGGPHIYPEMAPAGLWTTASDLALFAIEIQKSLTGKANHVLSKSMTAEMLKPGGLGSWGLGLQLQVGGKPDRSNFGHGGADEGFISSLFAYNEGDGLAVMTNADNGGQLVNEITRTVAHEYGWPDFQPRVKSIASVTPAILGKYVGHYVVGPYRLVAVTRDGNRLFWGSRGQTTQLFPASEKEWFLPDYDVDVSFAMDSQGSVTQVTIHPDGQAPVSAKRIDDAEASRITADLAARVRNQTPQAGAEAALRRDIDEMSHGTPNYDHMSVSLADVVRQQLPDLKSQIAKFGTLQTISFKRVEPVDGSDVYDIQFANGNTEWHVLLDADGRVESEGFQPIP